MKIKTITCQHVYNYGASLQAYALQSYLMSMGHEVEIIDYRLPNHNRYELFSISPNGKIYPLLKKIPLLRYVLSPIQHRWMLRTWGRKKSFDTFDRMYLNLTRTYRTIYELRQNPPEADIYIAGSDQIWNPTYLNGTDLGYYLDFGQDSVKRVSYAASFGVDKISKQHQEFISHELKKFNLVSVREIEGVNILNDLGIHAELCVDPVFLLNASEWKNRLNIKENLKDYILLYDFSHDDENIMNYTKKLSELTNCKIISLNDYSNATYADYQVNNAGPIEFLSYILNARFVISNSFHATAFSVIFHKKFVVYPLRKQKNSSRMTSLLQMSNLMERYMLKEDFDIDSEINWQEVDKLLNDRINNSKSYIRKILDLG